MEAFVNSQGDVCHAGVVNTYNSPQALSQTLQYLAWCDEDGNAHVLLQIHNGADVRGGYTAPRAFDLDHEESLTNVASATLSCSDCEAEWDTDDAHNWHARDGGSQWKGTTDECPSCGTGKLTVG